MGIFDSAKEKLDQVMGKDNAADTAAPADPNVAAPEAGSGDGGLEDFGLKSLDEKTDLDEKLDGMTDLDEKVDASTDLDEKFGAQADEKLGGFLNKE